MVMNILVTGGAGFIGSHLVDGLIEKGHNVRVLDALVSQVHGTNPTWPIWLSTEIDRIHGDVRDQSIWPKILKDVDVIYHLAAEVGVGQSMYEMTRYMSANTLGTTMLLEQLTRGKYHVQKLIVASSMSIYGEGAYIRHNGECQYPPIRSMGQLVRKQWELFLENPNEELMPIPTSEEKPLNPTSVYAISKRDQEELCLTVGRAYNIPTIALRFFNVYGPRQALSNPYTGVVAIFSSRLLNKKPPLIYEDGLQSRDFVHVNDIVQALILAMAHDEANYEAINVGSGQRVTILEIAEMLARVLNMSIKPQVIEQYRIGDIRHCFADIRKAQRLLNYEPKIKLEDGMLGLIEWLKKQTAIDKIDTATSELVSRGLTI
jgi:dTDP-L-rhamnose 4-epimerase